MKRAPIPWFRVAVVAAEIVLVTAAVLVPAIITADVLAGLLRILELVAKVI